MPSLDMDAVARRLAKAWGFEPTEELPRGHCSRVFANAGQVLKIPFQGEEQTSGCRAAIRMSGTVGPRVLQSDDATGALLMERIMPGTTLAESGMDDAAIRKVLLDLARRIAKLDPQGLMPVSEFVNPDRPLAKALIETTKSNVFLHGDLHHDNVLLGPNGWVAIDPKGLIGDPAFEPSAFLRSPYHQLKGRPDLEALIADRTAALELETGWDSWRMAAWSVLALGTDETGHWDPVLAALSRVEANLRPLDPALES